MRMRRAQELGLSYPQYASILTGSGRDIIGFLFTAEGMHLRLQRRLEMPQTVSTKLADLRNCQLLAFAPSGEAPEPFRAELAQISGLDIAAAGPGPLDPAGWALARQAIRSLLDPLRLPGNAVVLIGTRAEEEYWASAGKLARFLHRDTYFGAGAVA